MGKGQKFTKEYLEVIPDFDPTGPNKPQIVRVAGIRGKGIVELQLASGDTTLAVLPPKFRGTLWLRRGALVIATEIPKEASQAEDKVTLSIEHLLTSDDIKQFRKEGHIPEAFQRPAVSSSDDESEEMSETGSGCTDEE